MNDTSSMALWTCGFCWGKTNIVTKHRALRVPSKPTQQLRRTTRSEQSASPANYLQNSKSITRWHIQAVDSSAQRESSFSDPRSNEVVSLWKRWRDTRLVLNCWACMCPEAPVSPLNKLPALPAEQAGEWKKPVAKAPSIYFLCGTAGFAAKESTESPTERKLSGSLLLAKDQRRGRAVGRQFKDYRIENTGDSGGWCQGGPEAEIKYYGWWGRF